MKVTGLGVQGTTCEAPFSVHNQNFNSNFVNLGNHWLDIETTNRVAFQCQQYASGMPNCQNWHRAMFPDTYDDLFFMAKRTAVLRFTSCRR